MITSSCGILSSKKDQAVSASDNPVNQANKAIDSFYLTKCSWPEKLAFDDVKEYMDSFYQTLDLLRECSASHNPLVDQLQQPIEN